MTKVIITLSNFGYWGSELAMPLLEFDKAGFQCDFATQTGEKPLVLSVSKDPSFIDPAQNKPVTDEATAAIVSQLDASDRLNHPLKLNDIDPSQYDALCMIGGSGTLLDMVNNRHLHSVIRAMVAANKPVGAICYAVAALAYCRAENSQRSIIYGRKVTGHIIKYDYTDAMATGFAGTDLLIPGAPYPLEYVLRDAVGPDGEFVANADAPNSVVLDAPFLTARSTQDTELFGQKFVQLVNRPDRSTRQIEILDGLELTTA